MNEIVLDTDSIERFLLCVTDRPDGRCWIWQGSIQPSGYGQFWLNGKMVRPHRVAYTLWIGSIPEGKQLDHVRERGCISRACVNPAHLEAVTSRINTLRGDGFAAINLQKTHCPQGHEYSPQNTYARKGMRHCKTCLDERQRSRRAQRGPGESQRTVHGLTHDGSEIVRYDRAGRWFIEQGGSRKRVSLPEAVTAALGGVAYPNVIGGWRFDRALERTSK